MAILVSKVLAKPTVIGRTRTLAIGGNGRFARFANLTGTEALDKGSQLLRTVQNKVKNASLRLAVELQNMSDPLGSKTAVALPGVGSIPLSDVMEEVPSSNNCFSSSNVTRSGDSDAPKQRVTGEEEQDFRKFIELVYKEKKVNLAMALTYFATLGVGTTLGLILFGGKIEDDGQANPLLRATGKAIWYMVAVGLVLLSEALAFSTYFSLENEPLTKTLILRYEDHGIPMGFKDINPSAVDRLQLIIDKRRAYSHKT